MTEHHSILSNYPYFSDGQFSLENIQPYLLNEYLDSIRGNASDFIKITPQEFIHARILKWDSDHFKMPMARIDHFYFIGDSLVKAYQELIAWFNDHKVKHISIRLNLNNKKSINFLAQNGFEIITGKMMFRTDLRYNAAAKKTGYEITSGVEGKDVPMLVEIARSSFYENRFMLDPHLNAAQSSALYERWLYTDIEKKPGNISLMKKDSEILGFSLIDKLNLISPEKAGFISLIAVKEGSQGKGIGKRLLASALAGFKEDSIQIAYANVVSTNYSSIALFQSCGFRIYANLLELRKFI
jgi:ribosomal protein S18 acetylase RimI-like enzyme